MSDLELEASIVAAVHSVRGNWCTPAWIAAEVVTTPRTAAALCYQLAARGELQARHHYGERVYGLQVVTDYPTVHDVPPADDKPVVVAPWKWDTA